MPSDIDAAIIGGGVNAWWDPEGRHTHKDLLSAEQVKELLSWEVELDPIEDRNGNLTKWNMVVREDTEAALAVVGPRFSPLQNVELIDGLIVIAGEADLGFESGLSLKGGEIVAACARFPEHMEIAGEEYQSYLNAVNYHTGIGMGQYFAGNVRMVCRNTVDFALIQAPRIFRFRHVGDMSQRVEEARRVLGMAQKYNEEYQALGNELALQPMTTREFEKFLKEVVPEPSKKFGKYDEQLPAVLKTREGMKAVWSDTPDLENIKKT